MIVVFVDRDGVINRNRDDYVKTVSEFDFLPGALEGLAKLKLAGAITIVVSNQAGVGRGIIDPAELARINDNMLQTVKKHGGEISAVYYCLHRKEEECNCRKPEPGLLVQASKDFGLNLEECFLVGDARSDIEAGQKVGCKTVLVLTGKTSRSDVESWNCKPLHVADDLLNAVDWIVSECCNDSHR